METWLRTNTRAVWFGAIPPMMLAAVGLALALGLPGHTPVNWVRVVGAVLLALGLVGVIAIISQLRRPRLAYDQKQLLLWLRSGPPIRVPIEIVECFWLGQAPSLLPSKHHADAETAAVVIRLAESAAEWRHQDVKPQLGKWCEGYITIRGTWCEPLSVALINRLNQRLVEATRKSPHEISP